MTYLFNEQKGGQCGWNRMNKGEVRDVTDQITYGLVDHWIILSVSDMGSVEGFGQRRDMRVTY